MVSGERCGWNERATAIGEWNCAPDSSPSAKPLCPVPTNRSHTLTAQSQQQKARSKGETTAQCERLTNTAAATATDGYPETLTAIAHIHSIDGMRLIASHKQFRGVQVHC